MAVSVLLQVKSLLEQDEQQNIIDYQTRGYLYHKGQVTYLQYREGTEGLEGVQTTLKLEKDRVTLIRHGAVAMRQVFEIGLNDQWEYQTTFGSLNMGTTTSLLEIVLGFDEGSIRVVYDLYLEGEISSRNTLEISYRYLEENSNVDLSSESDDQGTS